MNTPTQHQITYDEQMKWYMYKLYIVGSVNQELNAMALHHWKYGVVDDMVLSHITSTASYSGFNSPARVCLLACSCVGCCQRFRLWLNYIVLPSPYIIFHHFFFLSLSPLHCHGNRFWLNFQHHLNQNSKLLSSLHC